MQVHASVFNFKEPSASMVSTDNTEASLLFRPAEDEGEESSSPPKAAPR